MIQDPTNQYISTILSQVDINGKKVLEIGCGKGRITRDLAKHASCVVAGDPDSAALEVARRFVLTDNVEFLSTPDGMPDHPSESFDMVIYTLSFHHVPIKEMTAGLLKAGSLLRKNGAIVILEPGDGGSFTAAKERFGAGSGDERPARKAAIQAMHCLDNWMVEETILFRVMFQFDDAEDFLNNMLPGYRQQPESFELDVRWFLDQHRTENGIFLDAERRLNVLRKR